MQYARPALRRAGASLCRQPARGARVSSSGKWRLRQQNDEYVLKAQKLGYRARSAFKLLQMDHKLSLLQEGQVALELGAAPGSWSQVCVQKGVRVVGVDLLPIEPLDGATFLQADFTSADAQLELLEALGGQADLVLSDLSPNRSGHKSLDQARLVDLTEQALLLSRRCLKPGGNMLCKLLQGADQQHVMKAMKSFFEHGALLKPPASRKQSSEIYLCATGFDPQRFDDSPWLRGEQT